LILLFMLPAVAGMKVHATMSSLFLLRWHFADFFLT
jgi:hypothetical protein